MKNNRVIKDFLRITKVKLIHKIKYYFIIKKIYNRADFKKMSFIDYFLGYARNIIKFVLPIFAWGSLLVFEIFCNIKGKDVLVFIPNEDNIINEMKDMAFTMYGLQLTVFSIIVSVKHKKFFSKTEFKMLSNVDFHGYNIKTLFLYTNYYLILLIINICADFPIKRTAFMLLFFSAILLILVIKLIFLSSAKLHYNYNNRGMKKNPLLRKIWVC